MAVMDAGVPVTALVLALAVNGLVWGLIIALIALGLSIIFGLLDIINVAHGDFFMLGTVFASWFMVTLLGLTTVTLLTGDSPLKGYISMVFGLMLAMVGFDIVRRFSHIWS